MQQLTAQQFLSEFQIADGWTLSRSLSTMQLSLTVPDLTGGEDLMYGGPEPASMTDEEYKAFLKEVQEVAAGHAEGAGSYRVEP